MVIDLLWLFFSFDSNLLSSVVVSLFDGEFFVDTQRREGLSLRTNCFTNVCIGNDLYMLVVLALGGVFWCFWITFCFDMMQLQ